MKTKEIISQYKELDYNELSEQDAKLVDEARKVALKAYAPYSKFFVGSAVLLQNGEIVTGNNQENAAYPAGLCAERVAIFSANALHPDIPIVAVAAAAYTNSEYTAKPVPPCGTCRQVLLETETRFKTPIRLLLVGRNKVLLFENQKDLLPLSFTDDFL